MIRCAAPKRKSAVWFERKKESSDAAPTSGPSVLQPEKPPYSPFLPFEKSPPSLPPLLVPQEVDYFFDRDGSEPLSPPPTYTPTLDLAFSDRKEFEKSCENPTMLHHKIKIT